MAVLIQPLNYAIFNGICYYFNYLLNALLIIHLINNNIPIVNKKWDKIIGDYSYPLYLFHYQAAFAVSMLFWQKPILNTGIEGFMNFAGTLVLCFTVSWLVLQLIDKPIAHIRNAIKMNNRKHGNNM